MTDSAQKYAIAYFTGKRGWITGSERYQTQDQARQRRTNADPAKARPMRLINRLRTRRAQWNIKRSFGAQQPSN